MLDFPCVLINDIMLAGLFTGVPAPAPAPAVTAPVPGPVGIPARAPAPGTVTAPSPRNTAPTPAPSSLTATASNGSSPAAAPGTLIAAPTLDGALAPDSAVVTPSGSTAVLSPTVAPAPATPAASPEVAVPAIAPVSTTVAQYQNISSFPATVNSSAYSTATVQITVTNTTLALFDAASQTALLNSVNNYLQAHGYSNFYMGLDSISVGLCALPLLVAAAPLCIVTRPSASAQGCVSTAFATSGSAFVINRALG